MKNDKCKMKRPIQMGFAVPLVVLLTLLIAVLACEMGTTTSNIRIGQLPQYICPSATPRATDTPLPTSPPTYPGHFIANLSNYEVGSNISSVTVQWLAQSAGSIYANYSGSMASAPYFWNGGTNVYIGYSYQDQPAQYGSFAIFIPGEVYSATIQVWATYAGAYQTFYVQRVGGNVGQFYPSPNFNPPLPIYPTPRPTYTPYPTPTPYVRTNDYFVGDAIYTAPEEEAQRVRFRLVSVRELPAPPTATPDYPTDTPSPRRTATPNIPQELYVWTFRVKNVGTQEFNFYPAMQSTITTIKQPNGVELNGIWAATWGAGDAAGIPLDGYGLYSMAPREEVEITLAAFAPQGELWRVSWAMDASSRATPIVGQPTPVTAGSNIVSWINTINTECSGEIAEPQ